jgi:hypothetical protein
MASEPRDETRRLLKLFGVAVTDFEEEAARLLDGWRAAPRPPDAAQLRDALALLLEVNRRWRAVTEHLFEMQVRFLEGALAAVPDERGEP